MKSVPYPLNLPITFSDKEYARMSRLYTDHLSFFDRHDPTKSASGAEKKRN